MKIGRALFVFLTVIPLLSRACDLCGCFTPQLETNLGGPLEPLFPGSKGLYAAVAEQFTHFGTMQFEGHEVANTTGQYENSFITQLVAGYDLTSRFALQLNVPLIYREFKRPEGFAIDRGTESGLGDISLLLRTVAYKYSSPVRREFDVSGKNPVAVERDPDLTFSAVILTGVKFPTGGTSRLTEEFHEIDVPGAPESGIHGHDLTLGTGSYDGIFGGQASVRWKNFFFESSVQFTLRGSGAHDYDFANDLSWDAGPGYYFVRRPDCAIGLELRTNGETKDTDRFRGAPAEDTGMTEEYLGPRIVASYGRWSGEFAVEIPVLIDNTALQAVPDYRLKAGIAFRF
jgi:hypothetical protein